MATISSDRARARGSERPLLSTRDVYVGVLLLVVTGALLYAFVLVVQSPIGTSLGQIIIILAGMSAAAAFNSLQRPVRNAFIDAEFREIPPVEVDRSMVDTVYALPQAAGSGQRTDSDSVGVRPESDAESGLENPQPWNLTSAHLIGVDNALALADLRITVEDEMRRIAYMNGINLQSRPVGAEGLVTELVARQILPDAWASVLEEILAACAQAVHGSDIKTEDAAAIVQAGTEMLERLGRIGKVASTQRSSS